MTDQEIIQEVVAGKTAKFEVVVKKYHSYLQKVGAYYLYEKTEVDDMIQTTYLKAFENLSRFRGEASFKSWLVRIMINECKQANRKKGLFKKFQTKTYNQDWEHERSSESAIMNKEVKQQLDQAISRLSPKYKSVLVQRLVMGSSTQDTAADLGISEEAVKVRLFRARKKLMVDLLKDSEMEQLFVRQPSYRMATA